MTRLRPSSPRTPATTARAPLWARLARGLQLAAVVLALGALGTGPGNAQGLTAENLLEIAGLRADGGGAGAEANVTSLLTRIETEHPDTDLGLQVTLLRSRGMGDLDILAALRGTAAPAQAAPARQTGQAAGAAASGATAGAGGGGAARSASEAERTAQIDALHRQAMSSFGPARASALADLLGLMEQTALEYPNGELAWRLRQDDSFRGINHGAIRRELASMRATPGVASDSRAPAIIPSAGGRVQPASEFDEQSSSLTDAERREIQGRLTSLGQNTRGVDGRFGPGTRGAISGWQQSAGIPATGFMNRSQLDRLRADSADSYPRWQEQQRSAQPAGPARVPSAFSHPRRSGQQTLADARACGANVVLFAISIPQSRAGQVVSCMRRRGYTPIYR